MAWRIGTTLVIVAWLLGVLAAPTRTLHAEDPPAAGDPGATLTSMPTPSATATAMPTPSATATAMPTPSATATVEPTSSATATPTLTATATPRQDSAALDVIASHSAWVEEAAPTLPHPNSATLVVGGAPGNAAFVGFDVSGIDGRVVQEAILMVWCLDGGEDGPAVYPADPGWAADEVTWSHQPQLIGWSPDDRGAVRGGGWVTWNVSGLVSADGSVAFALLSSSADPVTLVGVGDDETAPRLVLRVTADGSAPTPMPPVASSPTTTPTASATATGIAVERTTTPTPTATTPAAASITLSPVKGKFNDVIAVSLTGFTPNSPITVRWPDGTELAKVNAGSNGAAQTSFRTPLSPYGDYRVEARDAAGRSTQATLRVIPRVNLAPTSGAAGAQTRVYLYGYAADERVEVRWYDTSTSFRVLTTLTIAADGRASRVVTVPANATLGAHKVMGKVVGVARSASLPFTVTSVVTPAEDSPQVGPNPFAGATLYVRPDSSAKRQADAWRTSRPTDAAAMDRLANQPTADWLGPWDQSIRASVDDRVSRAASAGRLPVLVAYNLGMNACANTGAQAPDAYKAWIRAFASGIGNRSAVVILEPDALAMIGCMSGGAYETRMLLFRDAVRVLDARPGVTTYIDAGHANWVSPADMAARLQSAGVGRAQGFSLNVSNFGWTSSNAAYGRDLSARLGGRHFVIDTSRNGAGPAPDGAWCNPAGRAVGPVPTARTGDHLIDAYLWIKPPGESDGTCNGGPEAGYWWAEYALGLIRRAPR